MQYGLGAQYNTKLVLAYEHENTLVRSFDRKK